MKNILNKMDAIVCAYLGLKNSTIIPNTVQLQSNNLFVTTTESFKRHLYKQSWEEFNNSNLSQLNKHNKEKLGIAIGKILAQKLTISFEEIQIKRETSDA